MEHIWKVIDLSRTVGDNVVTNIMFSLESSLGTDPIFYDRKLGEVEISGSASDPGFINFEDLTESVVVGWAKDSIDSAVWEAELSSSLAAALEGYTPPTHTSGLPW
jgi:hypothetical protein